MKRKKKPQWRPLPIPPKYLAGMFFLLIIAFSATAFLHYKSRMEEIDNLMHEESSLLIHFLTEGTETALIGYNEINALVTGGLVDQLRLIERMDSQKALTSNDLSEIAGKSGMYRITIIDRDGKRIAWNSPPDHTPLLRNCDTSSQLMPILSGKTEVLNLGIRESAAGKGARLVVAVARRRGGAIVGNVDASRLLAKQREIGPGRLIQRTGHDAAGIDYIIWQDTSAIIAATPNVTETETIQSDPALSRALQQNKSITRFTKFRGRDVFEVIKPFIYQGNKVGLLRIGLKIDHFVEASEKIQTRLLLLLALAVIGGLAVFNLIITRRNELVVKDAYLREKLFSSSILENMADAVIAVNTEGRITLVNSAAEQLFSITGTDVIDKPVREILPECGTLLMELIASPTTANTTEFECITKNRRLILSGHFSLITGTENFSDGAFVVLRDMTEQRSMQKVIERQEKLTAMGELASGVAHEIRNPLNAIGVLGQRLDMEFSPTEDEQEYHHLVRAIVSEVHRVNAIIQRFLKFARPPQLMLAPSDLDELIEQYRPVLEGEAEAKGLHFRLKACSESKVSIDREQMQQVLLNLVQNAVEATQENGIVTVTAGKRSGTAFIEVVDTGKGIPGKMLSQIFNLYFTSKDNGTGMGLSIANQIIQAHGGILEVESREGEGSVFRIILPLL
ncbi:MAG: ATP-binding protein [Chlorobiaceae bacterium]